MKKTNTNQQKLTIGLLVLYLLLLTWIILLKMQFSLQGLHLRSINLIPYAASVIINNTVDFKEIFYNVFAFIPFGIYVSMLKPDWSFLKKAAPIAGVSLSYEVLQFVFSIGASDITDLIGNTLGGIIGIVVYYLFRQLFKTDLKTNKVLNLLALIGTVCLLALLALLIIANL